MLEDVPRERVPRSLDPHGGRARAFQGLPARICWLGYGERDRVGLRFNAMVADGDPASADRHRTGPPRLRVGRFALPGDRGHGATGPTPSPTGRLLNALLNTASGASWVSIHHGGGVGIGRSIHAGQVSVADGTALAAKKLERVLTNDPGSGVIRHVDAGYAEAVEVAAANGLRVPMRDHAES